MARQVAVPETDGKLQRMFRLARLLDRQRRDKDPTGLKRWFVPGTEFEGEGVLTPYANRTLRRSRRRRRASHESRRRNRS